MTILCGFFAGVFAHCTLKKYLERPEPVETYDDTIKREG